jgi:hypothetical protein
MFRRDREDLYRRAPREDVQAFPIGAAEHLGDVDVDQMLRWHVGSNGYFFT